MKEQILVTGATGQVGGEIRRIFPDAYYPGREELDLSSEESIRNYFKKNSIEKVINCGAYTLVDKAESEKDLARKINSTAPGILAELCPKILHLSTDYVFNGKSQRPYLETDSPDPINFYGETKLEGEKSLQKASAQSVILRTSWVYSDLGKNFVKTMIKFGSERPELRVVADQTGTPTYAADIAKLIVDRAMRSWDFPSGIYNFSNEGATTWYEFASEIMKMRGLNCKVIPITTEEYPTPAKRPAFSLLDKTKIKKELGIDIPDWKEGLKQCLTKLS